MSESIVTKDNLQYFLLKLKDIFSGIGHSHSISDIVDYSVDSSLSTTSNAPLQNKIITNAINSEIERATSAESTLSDRIDRLIETTNNSYSDSEWVVGTWIDGRPIYRTTIMYNATLGTVVANGTKNYWAYYDELDDLNIDMFVKAEGMALCYSDKAITEPRWQPIPRVCPDACEKYSIGIGDLSSDSIGVLFGTSYTSATIYFTIEYVKTATV